MPRLGTLATAEFPIFLGYQDQARIPSSLTALKVTQVWCFSHGSDIIRLSYARAATSCLSKNNARSILISYLSKLDRLPVRSGALLSGIPTDHPATDANMWHLLVFDIPSKVEAVKGAGIKGVSHFDSELRPPPCQRAYREELLADDYTEKFGVFFGAGWPDAKLAAGAFSLEQPSGGLRVRHRDQLGGLPEVMGVLAG